jgi:hypothetical protein
MASVTINGNGQTTIASPSPILSPGNILSVSSGRCAFVANSEPYAIGAKFNSTSGAVYFGATNASSTPDAQISAAGGGALITLQNAGQVTIPNLAGAGTRLVQASSTGLLSTTTPVTSTYQTNAQTLSITGLVGQDIIATGCQITLSPGTYMVQAQITVINTVTQDSCLCYIYNTTTNTAVSNSRGANNTSFTTQYSQLVSNLTIVVLATTEILCPAATRNGTSALTCPTANVCNGPNVVITAIRIA